MVIGGSSGAALTGIWLGWELAWKILNTPIH
jgi:hypothetical protein